MKEYTVKMFVNDEWVQGTMADGTELAVQQEEAKATWDMCRALVSWNVARLDGRADSEPVRWFVVSREAGEEEWIFEHNDDGIKYEKE